MTIRMIRRTTQFKRDYKREKKGISNAKRDELEKLLIEITELLIQERPLPTANADHPLAGEWKDCRDCHIKPDLILIYRVYDDILELARLGSHSKLGL